MTQRNAARYSRVLLKLSGEALLGERKFGISPQYVKYLAEEIRKVQSLPTEVAIVIADCTRVGTSICSSADWSASALMTIASIPI